MTPTTRPRPTRRTRHAPDLLPILGKGAHRRPQHGACLMEYVSVLTGARFNDHPRCTHPALATLARLVNDEIDNDDIRSELAVLAPDLAAIHRSEVSTAPVVIATCLRAAAMLATTDTATAPSPPRQRLAELDGRTDRLRTSSWTRRWARCAQALDTGQYGTAAVRSAFSQFDEQARALAPEQRDVLLYLLLAGAVSRCRRHARADHTGVRPWEVSTRSR